MSISPRQEIKAQRQTIELLIAENERLAKHLNRLQRISVVVISDWWPLVHDRTCRDTVRAQFKTFSNAISNED